MVKTRNYSSAALSKIFQPKPIYSKPSQFRPKGWTDTVLGYINEAKKLTLCLWRNRAAMKGSYTWAVHLNLSVELPPTKITEMWKNACRTLRRRGVIALWVREPSKSNRVHYHLIVRSRIGKKKLERAIEEAMPVRTEVKWRKRVEEIDNEWFYCHYLTKAKIGGVVKGRPVKDRYAKKRLLFRSNLKLKKYGVIGQFWEKPKAKFWDEIKETEKRITDGLEQPNVRKLARHIYTILDRTVPLERIERSLGLRAESQPILEWIDSLLAAEGGAPGNSCT